MVCSPMEEWWSVFRWRNARNKWYRYPAYVISNVSEKSQVELRLRRCFDYAQHDVIRTRFLGSRLRMTWLVTVKLRRSKKNEERAASRRERTPLYVTKGNASANAENKQHEIDLLNSAAQARSAPYDVMRSLSAVRLFEAEKLGTGTGGREKLCVIIELRRV